MAMKKAAKKTAAKKTTQTAPAKTRALEGSRDVGDPETDPTPAELQAQIDTLNSEVATMQGQITALQDQGTTTVQELVQTLAAYGIVPIPVEPPPAS